MLKGKLVINKQEEDGNYKFTGVESYMTCGFKNVFGDDAELIASVALDLILTTYPDNADYLQSFVYTYPDNREVNFWCINDVEHITFLLPCEY